MSTIVRGACPLDCPDTCSWLVEVEDGRAVALRGDRSHPFTHGALCPKVNRYLDALHGPGRVTHPLRRVGRQGRGPLRADRLGRGARRDCRRPALGDRAARPRVGAAVLLRRHRGHGAGLDHGAAPVRGARRLAPARRRSARRPPAPRWAPPTAAPWAWIPRTSSSRSCHPVGRQPALDEPAPVALRARGAAPRRARRRDRSAAHRHRRSLRRARRAPPGHRRGARARPHARRARRGRRGSRLARAPHARAGPSSRRAWPNGRSSAPREVCGLPGRARRARSAQRFAHTRPTAIRLGLGLQRHGGAGAAMRAILALPALTGDFRHVGGGVLCMTGGHFGGIDAGPRDACRPTCPRRRRARSTCRASARR